MNTNKNPRVKRRKATEKMKRKLTGKQKELETSVLAQDPERPGLKEGQ